MKSKMKKESYTVQKGDKVKKKKMTERTYKRRSMSKIHLKEINKLIKSQKKKKKTNRQYTCWK